jgi:hypothetical protein
MKIKKIILSTFFFLSFFAFAQSAQAADYYVDCSASTNGNGTFASPWNNLPSVNAKTFAAGDDIYFKVGTTCYLNSDSDRLQIKHSGVSSDQVIVGAYYGNGQFGLGSRERPIIDGRNNQYPGSEQGAIDIRNRSYVTVRDLKIQYAGRIGSIGAKSFDVRDSSYVTIENNHSWRSNGSCILFLKVTNSQIIDNICHEAGHPDYTGTGAAVEVTAGRVVGAATNILVARNKVFNCKQEGIGFYKGTTYSIAEYNIIYGIRAGHLYNGSSQHNTFRYNLLYNIPNKIHSSFKAFALGMGSDIEKQHGSVNRFV